MIKFFKDELVGLKMKTSLNQFENLKQEPDWQKKANSLVTELVAETERPPYHRIKIEVLQNVLRDAMLSDKDFIGLTPRWVRITLNAWWSTYGGKILEAMAAVDQSEEKEKPAYSGPPIDVDTIVKEYLHRLQEKPMVRAVPKVSPIEAKIEGQARPKAIIHSKTDVQYLVEHDRRIRANQERWFRENYPGATDEEVTAYLERINNPKKKKRHGRTK